MESTTVCAESANKRLFSSFGLFICAVAALGGLLFGYDTAVISGAIGFLQTYFHLSPAGAGWAASSALAGCVLGAAGAGYISDTVGRRLLLLISAIMFLLSAFGAAMASNFSVFVVFRIIGGVGIGAASMASPLYIAEIAPARWRGSLVATNQLAIIAGMLLVYLVNYWIVLHGDLAWNVATGWRWMFASGAFPSLALFLLLFIVPETPRFLALKGRTEEARHIMARLEGSQAAQLEISDLRRITDGDSGALFNPESLRIIGLGVVLACLQQVTGINVFLYYAPELFKHMGARTDAALVQTVVVGVINLLFTIFAILTVDRVGRKILWTLGAAGMGLCLSAMGVAAVIANAGNWLLIFVLGYIACFACSVGPVTWIILSEMFPLRLRGRSMAVATVALWLANFAVSQTFPMLDQNARLVERFHHGFPFFIYALCCFLGSWFVVTQLPETKRKSLEEIEAWWRGKQTSVS